MKITFDKSDLDAILKCDLDLILSVIGECNANGVLEISTGDVKAFVREVASRVACIMEREMNGSATIVARWIDQVGATAVALQPSGDPRTDYINAATDVAGAWPDMYLNNDGFDVAVDEDGKEYGAGESWPYLHLDENGYYVVGDGSGSEYVTGSRANANECYVMYRKQFFEKLGMIDEQRLEYEQL